MPNEIRGSGRGRRLARRAFLNGMGIFAFLLAARATRVPAGTIFPGAGTGDRLGGPDPADWDPPLAWGNDHGRFAQPVAMRRSG
jgi:hypothetical protein